jgi:hypothetical protein
MFQDRAEQHHSRRLKCFAAWLSEAKPSAATRSALPIDGFCNSASKTRVYRDRASHGIKSNSNPAPVQQPFHPGAGFRWNAVWSITASTRQPAGWTDTKSEVATLVLEKGRLIRNLREFICQLS